MNIYFAGSIRAGRQDKELYNALIAHLQQFGTVLTEHIGLSELSERGENLDAEEIYHRDMAWLRDADIVVAEVTQPSLGVGYELGTIDGEKPVICLYRKREGKTLSAMILGNSRFTLFQYEGIDEAKDFLTNYFRENK